MPRPKSLVAVACVAVGAVVVLDAQLNNPLPAVVEKTRVWPSRYGTSRVCPTRAASGPPGRGCDLQPRGRG